MGLTLSGGRSHTLYSDMTFDACASHVMLCASSWMSSASSVMLGHRLMRVSCVELGAPWVTEASQLRGIFLLFLLPCSIWYLHLLKIIYLWTSLDITLDLTCWM